MSDDEEQFNPKAHKNLLDAIGSLGKTQHIRKTTRSEPQIQQDEFQLVKSAKIVKERPRSNHVGIRDIVEVLKTTKKHLNAGKQLKNMHSTKKVLERPLEKPAAERMKRTIGYEKVKKKLERWDAIVAKNRAAETQVFPIQTETIYVDTSAHAKPLQLSLKSDLMREMEATDAKLKALQKERVGDTTDEKEIEKNELEQMKKKLTRDELMARRKELAYLKMRESQKSAKARMQNKIKSKKYHKLLKRQKLQEQIKQFELLQKTNPEAALEKLNELEKNRVLERASLRHKNTGSWAKNLQIRAKYDKDVRKDLAEQLEVSRQLTEKKTVEDSDEEERAQTVLQDNKMEADEDVTANDPFNPWTRVGSGTAKPNESTEDEKENWRKYWLQRNANEQLLDAYKKELMAQAKEESSDGDDENNEEDNHVDETKNIAIAKTTAANDTTKKQQNGKVKTKREKRRTIENGWIVEVVKPETKNNKNIDDIFDAQEDKIKQKLNKKLKLLTKEAKKLKKAAGKKQITKAQKDALKNLKDLSFKQEVKRPIIDEELNHEELNGEANDALSETLTKAQADKASITVTNKPALSSQTDTIDPTQLAPVKLKQHVPTFNDVNDAIEDADMHEDDEAAQHAAKQMTISQAFEDDDIIADFSKDKSKDSELKNTEIQLSMPGWGSWAGAGISQERTANNNKRLILKLAKEEKRRDDNKDGLYINETPSKQLRTHLVSDLPFPFTSLQDYEASIRAPLGRNFVPETAFRMLTRPAVITRKGTVIEPMDEQELVKPPRRLRHVVDKRIARAAEPAADAVAPVKVAKFKRANVKVK